MIIGVPKEIKLQEHRIGLTPDSVKVLTDKGHEVFIIDNLSRGNILNIPTVGFVRGDELINQNKNPTLKFSQQNGMKLKFKARNIYRLKEKSDIVSNYLKVF